MPAEQTYANCFTVLWSLMTYSAGMPILYPIAVLTFFMMFVVNKIILVKFYSKSTIFDHHLQESSIVFYKLSICFHVVMTAFIYSS